MTRWAEAGMDHDHYRWSPLPSRPTFCWPGERKLALCVLVTLDHYPLERLPGTHTSPELPGGRGGTPFPDVVAYTTREYGLRIGAFRIIDALQRHDIRATVAVDAVVANDCPALVNAWRDQGCEFVAHGLSGRHLVTSGMTEDDERQYLSTSINSIAAATGSAPQGWCGTEYSESVRTPGLLAELGVRYVLDWPNDEQPYEMTGGAAGLASVPVMLELDDVYAHWKRGISMPRWEQMVVEAFDVLRSEATDQARVLTLSLHPWLIGQPQRIKSLEEVLSHFSKCDDLFWATGAEITSAYRNATAQSS